MWSSLRPRPISNDQFPMSNVSPGLIGIWSLVIGHWLVPDVAWAHGDDNVTAVSFLGPLILVAVVAAGVAVGRPLVRWLARQG
jgi:hypothetical protein